MLSEVLWSPIECYICLKRNRKNKHMNAIILTTQCIIGDSILEISYIIASLCFVFGLKMLSHPDKARKGNIIAAIGMGLAIVATIVLHHNSEGQPIGNIPYILV